MTDIERQIVVESCRFVDEVVPASPYVMSREYIEWLIAEKKIDFFAHGSDPCIDASTCECVYKSVREMGRFLEVSRTRGISTTDIVGRMLLFAREHHDRSVFSTAFSGVAASKGLSESPVVTVSSRGAAGAKVSSRSTRSTQASSRISRGSVAEDCQSTGQGSDGRAGARPRGVQGAVRDLASSDGSNGVEAAHRSEGGRGPAPCEVQASSTSRFYSTQQTTEDTFRDGLAAVHTDNEVPTQLLAQTQRIHMPIMREVKGAVHKDTAPRPALVPTPPPIRVVIRQVRVGGRRCLFHPPPRASVRGSSRAPRCPPPRNWPSKKSPSQNRGNDSTHGA